MSSVTKSRVARLGGTFGIRTGIAGAVFRWVDEMPLVLNFLLFHLPVSPLPFEFLQNHSCGKQY